MTCSYCNQNIFKTRLFPDERLIAKKAFLYATVKGRRFYCPKGNNSQHAPATEPDKEGTKG